MINFLTHGRTALKADYWAKRRVLYTLACRPAHTVCKHARPYVLLFHLDNRALCQTPLVLAIVEITISTFPACVNTIRAKVALRSHTLPGAFIAALWKLDTDWHKSNVVGTRTDTDTRTHLCFKPNRKAQSWTVILVARMLKCWGLTVELLTAWHGGRWNSDVATAVLRGGRVMWDEGFCLWIIYHLW